MLSKATAQLVAKVMGHFGDDKKRKAEQDPEAVNHAILILLDKELSDEYSTLSLSIEFATCDDYLKEAREKMEKSQ